MLLMLLLSAVRTDVFKLGMRLQTEWTSTAIQGLEAFVDSIDESITAMERIRINDFHFLLLERHPVQLFVQFGANACLDSTVYDLSSHQASR